MEKNNRCIHFNFSEPVTQSINIKVSETTSLETINSICDPVHCTEVHCCQHKYIDYTNDSICVKPSLSYADVIVYRTERPAGSMRTFEYFNRRLLYNNMTNDAITASATTSVTTTDNAVTINMKVYYKIVFYQNIFVTISLFALEFI